MFDLFKNVQKKQLKTFAASYDVLLSEKQQKQNMISVIETLCEDPVIKEDYYRTFNQELALHPIDLQEMIKCTKTERLRWTEEGKLSVLFYRSFSKCGKTYQCPYYDRQQAENLLQSDIIQWRNDWQKTVSEIRRKARQKAKVTQQNNKAIKQQAKLSFEIEKDLFLAQSIEAGIVFSLCFWTQIINRWAKKNILLSYKATKRKDLLRSQASVLYSLKNRAVKVLQHSKYAALSFYRPKYPDKITFQMCDEHYSWFREEFEYQRWTPIDEYRNNPAPYDKCPFCSVEKTKDYYSLFFLQITLPNNTSFSFHTPYDIGKIFFPEESKLKLVSHKENEEGFFRFGRAVSEEEVKKYPENIAIAAFNDIFFIAEKFFKDDNNG